MAGNKVHWLNVTLVGAALLFTGVFPVSAQEAGEEAEIIGTVISVDPEAGLFVVEVDAEETYAVYPSEDYDFELLEVGDLVEVEGSLAEDGSILAVKVAVENEEEPDGEEPGEGESEGYYCVQSEDQHPLAARLSERYGVEYGVLQEWFCGELGWGEIFLALQTGVLTGEDPGDILALRGDAGWGEIWQEMELIGRPEDAGPPNDEDGDGIPDHAGPPNDEDGDGIPDHTGPPNDEDGDGIPDHAGPPNDEDGDGIPDHAGPPDWK